MLLIDKTKGLVRLLVTVSENTKGASPVYVLNIHSAFSNVSYSINLSSNTSPYPQRYDEFIMDASLFSDVVPGKYNYSIEEATIGVVEQGVLTITGEAEQVFQIITPQESDDDFLVYNP